jgi:hypothetical protein
LIIRKYTFLVFFILVAVTLSDHAQASSPWLSVGTYKSQAANRDPVDGPLLIAAAPAKPLQQANFRDKNPSKDARRVADWVVSSGDNDGLSFIVVDKVRAMVFVFDSNGELLGATSALLGEARGDESVPGIGSQKLSSITPQERTTPAGRFVAQLGHDLENNDILWIDYGTSLALHPVVRDSLVAHRLQRLSTTSLSDKRITYGCVNVPTGFYDDIVHKTFSGTTGIVYILPEVKAIQDVFPRLPR